MADPARPRWHIRYLPTDPHGRGGRLVPLTCSTREQADRIRAMSPNAEHMEVVGVGSDASHAPATGALADQERPEVAGDVGGGERP